MRTDPDGERQESNEWFRCGRGAGWATRLTKGGRVLVVGRLDISHYQSKDGESRTGFDVWADEVVNLAGRPAEGDRQRVGAGGRQAARTDDPVGADDLPF